MSQPLHSPALDQALAGFRSPVLFERLRGLELPADMLLLLRIAAGEARAIESACQGTGETETKVSEAAVLFIQQVMFHQDSDSYRALGVSALAEPAQIKEHHRWLVRWLHPDRNSDEWDAVYAERVNRAWQDLRTEDRRRDYDARRTGGKTAARREGVDAAAHRTLAPVRFDQGDEFLLSRRTARLLPVLVFGGLAFGAVGVLGLQYYLGREEPPEVAAIEVAEAKAPPKIDVASAPTPTPTPEPEPEIRSPEPIAMQPAAIAVAPDKPPPPVEMPVAKAVVKTAVANNAIVKNAAIQNAAAPVEIPASLPAKLPPPKVADVTPVVVGPPKASVSVQASTPSPAAPVSLIDQARAQQVMLRFRSAYASGNIQQMGAMLVRGAQGGGDERQTILKSYGELFKMSASRRIELHEPNWLTDGDTAILLASFDAWVVPRGGSRSQRFTGDIRFDLRLEDGELRIARLRQNSEQG